ncbi:unnamed protein product [Orchesella dallaii]|uniref:Uncharacterized protein n=1 Tax=Orchesella dallaii TaxID=48710 RepID=A0ABP1Q057_9HEXA
MKLLPSHFVKGKYLQKLLLLASTCTFHYVNDNSGNLSNNFESLFELSSAQQSIHLLTTDRPDRYLHQNATYNNWYLNNTYQSGFFKERKYKRGYWELFKLSKYSKACQLQIVDVQKNWRQLFYYFYLFLLRRSGNSAPTPNYILLIPSKLTGNITSLALRRGYKRVDVYTNDNLIATERIVKVRAPLPIFCLTNEQIYLIPFVLITTFHVQGFNVHPFTGYILPFRAFEIEDKISADHVEMIWKTKYLLETTKFKRVQNVERFLFEKWNKALQLYFLGIRLAENSMEYQLSLLNLSTISLQRRPLHADKFSKDYLQLIKQHPYIFRYGLTFEGFRYAVFIDVARIQSQFLVNLKALLLPFSTRLWVLAILTLVCISIIIYKAGNHRPIFYTFAILLEQGEVTLQSKSSLVIAIPMLLLLGFILRLSYTSSMYSHLTVEPKYQVPQSFDEGVLNANYYTLAEPHIVSGVFHRMSYDYNNTTQKYIVTNFTHQLLRNLAKRIYTLELLPIFLDVAYTNVSTESQLTSLANHNNTLFVEKLCVLAHVDVQKYGYFRLSPCKSEFVVADKFVYIFGDPVIVKDDSTGVDIFTTVLFGNKLMFKNNEPSVFHTMKGWVATHDLATEMADDIGGKLEQAGILNKWRQLQNFFLLLKSWRNTREWVTFRGRFNCNLVQVAYDLLEDLGLAERIGQVMSTKRLEVVTNRALTPVWLLFFLAIAASVVEFACEITSYKFV